MVAPTQTPPHTILNDAISLMNLPVEDTSLNESEPKLAALIRSNETPNEADLKNIPIKDLFHPSERTSA
jgi:hypothetical protein